MYKSREIKAKRVFEEYPQLVSNDVPYRVERLGRGEDGIMY
jgi:hypothetical protein